MFSKKIKHTQRYQEILNALIKNGFSHFLYRIGLTDRKKTTEKQNPEQKLSMTMQNIGVKLRQTMQELGPTFIKLGQIAASRRDVLPIEIVNELEKLQENVNPFSFEQVRTILETELDDELEHIFQHVNETPQASASIGQVHTATLKTGEQVAIKVQRPNIQKKMETDLEILHNLAKMIESKAEWAKTYHIKEIINDFSRSLRNELDYRTEAYHAEQIAKQFIDEPKIRIPKIYRKLSTEKVLTMEYIEGIGVRQLEAIEAKGLNRKIIAQRLADSMLHQVLDEGFFHGDPHSGNIYILPNNVVSYLDFGMIGRMNDEMRFHFASLVINIEERDTKGIIRTFSKWGLLHEDTATKTLKIDLDYLLTKYYDMELKQIRLGNVITELLSVAYRHKIDIPADIAILAKVIITLEAIIAELDPEFSLMKAVEPYGKKLIKERYHPKNILKDSAEELRDNIDTLRDLPLTFKRAAETVEKGKLRFDINVNDLQAFLHRFDKISNRISFSIILLAFSILMVGLIIGASISGHTTLLWKIPIIEIGSVVAILMFLFMIYSIIKSGRM
ncbi:ABC1 kinase family protein [Virgibacillus sp. W0181]|uniref:ABC1 kinase family protein n=1 Tax=Virgibacillus sp. W0181 TaxID=3391581 RepID=UPI003F447E1C